MTPVDRNSVLAAGLVVVTLLLGIVSGVALGRWMLRPGGEYVETPRGPGRPGMRGRFDPVQFKERMSEQLTRELALSVEQRVKVDSILSAQQATSRGVMEEVRPRDRKSTRLNSSHGYISYAVFCLKKKNRDR